MQYGSGCRNTGRRRFAKRKAKSQIIIDETLLKLGKQFVWVWVWVAIDESTRVILAMHISFERTMLVAEQFLNLW